MILGDKATLEAKGADAAKEGGGGGGGLISISYGEGFVGKEPVANENTKGGEGNVTGDNGIVVINGMLFSDQLRFLDNWAPTPPLSHNFALCEK